MPSLVALLRRGCCVTAPLSQHGDDGQLAPADSAMCNPNAQFCSKSPFAHVAGNAFPSASAAESLSGKLPHISSCPALDHQRTGFLHSSSSSGSGGAAVGSHVRKISSGPAGGMHGLRPSNSCASAESAFTARSESVFEISSRTASIRSKILRPQSTLGCSNQNGITTDSVGFVRRHLSLQRLDSTVSAAAAAATVIGTSARASSIRTKGLMPELQLQSAGAIARRVYTEPSAASMPSSMPQRTLLAAALDRTDSARLTKTETSNSSGAASRNTHGSSNSLSALVAATNATGGTASAAAAEGGAATTFGNAFLAALLEGNTRWASDEAVFELFAEDARMASHDKEVFYGKTAIIRRLNNGMEQFVKLLGSQLDGSSPEVLQAKAASVSSEVSVAIKERHAEGGAPRVVQISYCFKYGMRKYKLRDDITLRNGKIRRLKRLRL